MADSRRRFSREFKVEAVRQVLDGGRPLARVARERCTKTGWVCVWVIGELLAASFFPRPSRGARGFLTSTNVPPTFPSASRTPLKGVRR
jgi:hypothetical protein